MYEEKNNCLFIFCFFKPFCQTKERAIPIIIKSIVQTGPKSQLGGLKDGLFKEAYQVAIEGVVKAEPRKPAPRQIKTEIINLPKLLIFIYLILSNSISKIKVDPGGMLPAA